LVGAFAALPAAYHSRAAWMSGGLSTSAVLKDAAASAAATRPAVVEPVDG
jgi:hypothetical protein